MRKKTISILAVAFTASTAACGGATDGTIGNPGQQQSAAQGESTSPAAESTNKGTAATNGNEEPPNGEPAKAPSNTQPAACDRDALNEELSNTSSDDALARHEHFRCLCDDKGYPLVGNINSKGATASTFCAAITEKGLL